MHAFKVIKRDGRIEPFNPSKIEKVVNICARGLNLDTEKFWEKLSISLHGTIKSSEIQRNLIVTATGFIVTQENKEDWSVFAGRLLLVDFKKRLRLKRLAWFKTDDKTRVNRYGFFTEFEDFKRWVEEYIEKGVYTPLLKKVLAHPAVKELYNELLIDGFQNPLWNNRVKHSQLQKFIKTYLAEENNEPIETPEEVWFLQSVLGFWPSLERYGISADEYKAKVKKHFSHLSSFRIVPATPQMLNLRRARANLSSCFILDVKDSTESIVHTQGQIAQISRNAGGVGLYLGRLRPSGSWIKGNPGKANKITDWVKIFEATVNAFNQQGKRKGSLTVALPVWHKDFLDFLEVIDLDVGEIPKKSPDVFTQAILPDFFFEYHNKKGYLWLIDHHELVEVLGRKDLSLIDVSGEELKRRYDEVFKLAEEGKLKNAKRVKTGEILRKIFYYWGRKGLPYVFFEDNANLHSPFEEKIHSANLCVAPGTKILTKEYGYIEIEKAAGQSLHVWNGEEWSLSQIFKTGENYDRWYEVEFSNGEKIVVTDYHRWYVKQNPKGYSDSPTIIKRTHELRPGDVLEKWELPVIGGKEELPFAYENGFFSADGIAFDNHDAVYLCHTKQRLLPHFKGYYGSYCHTKPKCIVLRYKKGVLKPKFFVPDVSYTVESRIRWLEGLFDGGGSFTKNGSNPSLQLTSSNFEFLIGVKRMLETLGVSAKVVRGRKTDKARMRGGRDGKSIYTSNRSWQLIIPSSELQRLVLWGFKPKRLKLKSINASNRKVRRLVRVTAVRPLKGFVSDSYCFYEPKLNRGILNGVLTGNCVENFSPFDNTDPRDLYNIPADELGKVHTCNITNVNLYRLYKDGILFDDEKLKEFVFHLYEYMDNLLDLTNLPVKESKAHNNFYRTVTAGFLGLADLFVALTLDGGKYVGYRFKARKASKEETLKTVDKIFGRFALFAVEASVHLAGKRGAAPAFIEGKTKYSKGIILGRFDLNDDTVRAELEELVGGETVENIKNGLKRHGIRNTLLANCPPNTSTSILAGVSAGVMPAYNLVQIEDQQAGTFVHLVPLYKYPLLYDVYTRFSSLDDFDSLTDIIARIQRWIDAGISFEIVVNHNYFDTPEKLTALYLSLLAFARRKGIKAIYYFRHILRDRATDKPEVCEGCAS